MLMKTSLKASQLPQDTFAVSLYADDVMLLVYQTKQKLRMNLQQENQQC